jgi:protein-disulfide isomerase
MVLAAVAGFVFVLQVLLPTASGAEPANNVKALGSPDAPVTMVVYSDFQWPYCGQFAREAGQQTIEEYVRSGQVRLVYQHFAVLGEGSIRAAVASEAAAEQGAFWSYHDRLYDLLMTEGRSAYSPDRLQGIAADLGLNMEAFNASFSSQSTVARVRAETGEGERKGVRSTPTIFVNDRKIEGALPYAVFKTVIDEFLRAGGWFSRELTGAENPGDHALDLMGKLR